MRVCVCACVCIHTTNLSSYNFRLANLPEGGSNNTRDICTNTNINITNSYAFELRRWSMREAHLPVCVCELCVLCVLFCGACVCV